MRIGAETPGKVLLPTSDETAWLYTCNAAQLARYFRLHQPSVETMERILDKKLLADAAMEAGLAVLPTWEPRGLSDVVASAPSLPYPILIKPRTQLHRVHNDKGAVASSESELIEGFREYLSRESGSQAFLSPEKVPQEFTATPRAAVPLLQQFVEIGPEGVYSVSGFIDQTGELFVTRQASKVLQRSQPAGVGVCFESLPTDPGLSTAVYRLCRELGYFGIFEVEFIRFDGRWAVIDFNPRLFNQAAMDARRGMPLAHLAYLDAAGKTSELREAVAAAQHADEDHPAVFYDRFTLRAILLAKMLTRRASREERLYWQWWMERHATHSVDFAMDTTDRMPGLIHAVSDTVLGIKGIARFLRSTSKSAPGSNAVALRAVAAPPQRNKVTQATKVHQ